MGWLNNFLGLGKSASEIEEETYPAVIGSDKQHFSFVYTHKHWLANRDVSHHITGDIDIGIQYERAGTQKWSILMHNVQCDWELNCLPEIYLFFNCVKRIEIYVDQHGQLLDTLYPISQSIFLKEKQKEISKHVKDEKQAGNLKRFFVANLSNPQFLQKIIPHNQIIKTLINAMLAANLHNSKPGLDQIAAPYLIPGYFGNEAKLPIKACWLYKPAKDNGAALTWLRLGGLDEVQYEKQDLNPWISRLNDNFNIGSKLKVDFAEQYRFKLNQALNVTNLTYADHYLETIIADGWYKEEQVIIQEVNQEVANG